MTLDLLILKNCIFGGKRAVTWWICIVMADNKFENIVIQCASFQLACAYPDQDLSYAGYHFILSVSIFTITERNIIFISFI